MAQPTTSIYFNSTAPAAPTGNQNVKPQSDGATPQQSVTFYPQPATADLLGVVKPDGTTITISDGVITAISGGGGTTEEYAEPLTDGEGNLIFANGDVVMVVDGDVGGDGGGGVPTAISLGPDWPPTSPTSYDDEFTGTPLDPKWTVTTPANSGSPTLGGSLLAIQTTPTNSDHFTTVMQAAPATPYTITAKCFMQGPNQNFYYGGLCLGDGSGKWMTAYIQNDGLVCFQNWNSNTSFNTSNGSMGVQTGAYLYLQITDDGTYLIASISNDGFNFIPFCKVSRTVWLSSGPTQIGLIGGNNTGGSIPTIFSCDWFRRTA